MCSLCIESGSLVGEMCRYSANMCRYSAIMCRYSAHIDTLRRSLFWSQQFCTYSLHLVIALPSHLAMSLDMKLTPPTTTSIDKPLTVTACSHECCRKICEAVSVHVVRITDTRQRVMNRHEWIEFLVNESDCRKEELATQKKENQ